jgi:hypothetical protein
VDARDTPETDDLRAVLDRERRERSAPAWQSDAGASAAELDAAAVEEREASADT